MGVSAPPLIPDCLLGGLASVGDDRPWTGLLCWRGTAGAVMVDLVAACGAVWHRWLALGLLRVLSDVHVVRFIVDGRSFVLRTSGGQRAGYGVLRWSVLAPLLFSVCIRDLAGTVSGSCGCANGLAVLVAHRE